MLYIDIHVSKYTYMTCMIIKWWLQYFVHQLKDSDTCESWIALTGAQSLLVEKKQKHRVFERTTIRYLRGASVLNMYRKKNMATLFWGNPPLF